MTSNIKHNAIICWVCKKVLVSWFRHDFNSCGCPNEAFVDGGFDSFWYGAKRMDKVEHIYLLSITEAGKVKRKGKKK
jgi:hypothetical protein